MGLRLELHLLLVQLLGNDNAYFQPPENLKMNYPCIVYALDDEDARFADNAKYARTKRYSLTIIDEEPDSDIPDKVAVLPMCSFSRAFVADNLNHFVYNLYF